LKNAAWPSFHVVVKTDMGLFPEPIAHSIRKKRLRLAELSEMTGVKK